MKKAAIALVVLMLFSMTYAFAELNYFSSAMGAVASEPEPTASASGEPLISLREFSTAFHFAAYLLETGHTISVEGAYELSLTGDQALLKMVYNGCEILSLTLDEEGQDVISIHCTHANSVPGANKYFDDYTSLLMETMYGCGIEISSVVDVIRGTGFFDHADYGDSGEYIIGDLKVSYEVSRTFGLMFTFERA